MAVEEQPYADSDASSGAVAIQDKVRKRRRTMEQLISVVREVRQANLEEVLAVARARDIRHLVHFTPLRNLPSILEHGLIPRVHPKVKELSLRSRLSTDDQRRDNVYEASCLSVTSLNYWMFSSKRQRAPNEDWAVLGFHPEAVLRRPSLFCESNAAKYGGVGLEEKYFRNGSSVQAFESMFYDFATRRSELRLAPNQTTDIQAEILVLEVIEADAIIFVALHDCVSEEKRREVEASLPEGLQVVPPDSELHRNLFGKRYDVEKTIELRRLVARIRQRA